MDEAVAPRQTPGGRPIERGPEFSSVQEMLALIGAGKGVFPVPAHAARYDARPDVAYLPIKDGPAYEWRLIWRSTAETNRLRAFAQAALDFAKTHPNPLLAQPTENENHLR
jgi:DNA-binding transcriptional LysR family regulator